MRSEWEEVPLPDAIDFKEGPGIMARDFRDEGVPLVRVAGLSGAQSVLEGCNFLDPEKVEKKWAHFRIEPGDALLSTSASLGRVAVAGPEAKGAIPYTGIIRMRPRDGRVARSFIPYLLRAPGFQRQAEAVGSGSVLRHFGPTHLREMTVVLPPLDEQSRIARVLGSLDDKIENNRRIAATLEQIAATLFKARFVAFVGHDDLVESEIGPIPRGWSAMPVGDLASYVNGKAFTKFGNGRGRMVIRIAELKSGPGAATVYTDHDADPDFIANAGDILFAWSGSLDVYRWHREQALINQHIFKVVPRGYPKWFVYYALKLVMPEFQAIASDKATTMGHIKRSHLNDFAVAVPPAGELGVSDKVFEPLFDLALQARIEIETLARIRDLLLPRLVSGQIRVPADVFPDEDAA
jgi:type I restriction enzyme S subunit